METLAATTTFRGVTVRRSLIWAFLASMGGLFVSAPVHAQEEEVSARDRQAAGQAYDRGTAAYLAEDFETAARWFETAHRLAPAAAALVQAVRSHGRAGHAHRAATLALLLQNEYGDDRQARRTARSALGESNQMFRVDAQCEACTIEVDGALQGHTSFFLEADADHRVVASFANGTREETVRGGAGETRELSFETPVAPEPNPVDTPVEDGAGDPVGGDPGVVDDSSGGGGVPLAVSITAAVLTAGLGGVLIWSGIDALDGVEAYEMNPTIAGLEDGRSREERTNWLIASTAVLGAATVILLIFTDYGDGESADESADPEAVTAVPIFDIQQNGVTVGLRGRL